MKRIKIDFKSIENKRESWGMSKAELARRVDIEPEAMVKFLKSGKKLTDHINLIRDICLVLELDWWKIIK